MPAALSKADQLAGRFFMKGKDLIMEARLPCESASGHRSLLSLLICVASARSRPERGDSQRDSWFNLTAPASPLFSEEVALYRHLSRGFLPALLLEIILDASAIGGHQMLVLERPDGRKEAVSTSDAKLFVVERWTISLNPWVLSFPS